MFHDPVEPEIALFEAKKQEYEKQSVAHPLLRDLPLTLYGLMPVDTHQLEEIVLQRQPEVVQDPSVGLASADTRERATDTVGNALTARNRQLDAAVRTRLAQKKTEAREKHLPDLLSYALPRLERELQQLLPDPAAQLTLSIPPTDVQATQNIDVCCTMVALARAQKRNPADVARETAETFSSHPLVAQATAMGPFVNIRLEHTGFARMLLDQVREQKDHYGSYDEGKGDVVLVDYSAPNVAKNMTVAHLRSTIIGHALCNLHEAAGYVSLRVNHLGDWGTQFGKIIHQYRKEVRDGGDEFLRKLEENPAAVLMEIYRAFVAKEKEDTTAVAEARDIFLKLEKGDPELTALWEKFLAWSMKDFSHVYERLQIEFDATQGESFYEDRMEPVIADGLDKQVLRKNDDGAVVFPGQPLYDPSSGKMNDKMMKGKDNAYREEVILKPSGGTVYLTRDLAAIRYRTQELGAAKILYVIGKEQQRHCLMLFGMAEQLGYIKRGQAEHIDFGHLNIDGRKMKSRGGKMALLNDVLDESIQAAEAVIREKNTGADGRSAQMADADVADTAKKVGISAIIFNDLRQDRRRDIEFSPDTAKHVESGHCPYIQYTCCRLAAITAKNSGEDAASELNVPDELSALERAMLVAMAGFPRAIQDAVNSNAPHKIAAYMTELCQLANNFYTTHPVTRAEGPVRAFRLRLIESCRQVLLNAAHLLHIELPDRM